MVDVEAPDGHRVPEHHAIRVPFGAAGVLVVRTEPSGIRDGPDAATKSSAPQAELLLLWRHRFIPGSTGWEIPAGRIEAGETPAQAAAREALEETGYAVAGLESLARWHPSSGLSDQTFHVFVATEAQRVAEPQDTHEAERIAFVPLREAARALDAGEIPDGMTTVALYAYLRRVSAKSQLGEQDSGPQPQESS